MTHDLHLVSARRALVSVSDKTGLVDLARVLARHGVELVSTGGTAAALREAGLAVRGVEELTGFPEMLDGRVKTLHPRVHGGLLGRRDLPEHARAMREHGIEPIDLVIVNLYPFEQTVARAGVSRDEAVEQIDIGGPSMIRSGAKNHAHVCVCTEPTQYAALAGELDAHGGATTLEFRTACARAAFARTAAYDAAIARYLHAGEMFPPTLTLGARRVATLRYGENPHQHAAVYADDLARTASVVTARQLAGKELSYNNLLDAGAALELVQSLDRLDRSLAAACVVKHTNPCGAAEARTPVEAVRAAIAGDPLAAYGGILACSQAVDAHAARAMADDGAFFEVVVAPDFEAEAVRVLVERWKNCRLLAVGPMDAPEPLTTARTIPGGILVQERDRTVPSPGAWTLAAGPMPDAATLRAAAFLECVARALSSNAVCLGGRSGSASGPVLYGAGAGQMDRVAACRIAIDKAGARARGAIAFSDAFFPFADGPELLINAGVSVIVHPGGSKRDEETFRVCATRGVSCLVTGLRHFRH
jgi:phosphoribosylaminoimidazolecarboxamide formyltransferase/IMP cyclohydrolase